MKQASELLAKPVRWIGSSKEGLKSPWAKPLKGFGGAGVLEIVADAEGNAFRLDLIAARLARAKEDYELWLRNRSSL